MTAPVFAELRGRTAVVTGSTRGIGAGIADALEEAGMRVFRHGLSADARPGVLRADLADPEGVSGLAESIRAETDVVDLLVHNAGLEVPQRIDGLGRAELQRTLEVNLIAPLLLTRELLPLLRASAGGSVIDVTSIHDDVAYAGNVAYVASKAGLEAATRTLALELARSGIRVNSIAPGAIETDMNREVIDEMGRQGFESWIPLGRIGSIADITGAVLFLASDSARYITGARLLIDGGYSQALLRYGLE